jgi:hypothetical protein
MAEIYIKTQKEFDELPQKFEVYTYIYLKDTKERIVIIGRRGNSSVVAWGNSSVVARENSSVEAWENSSVEAWGNSSVVAWGNSSVVAWENSSVVAWGNSSVEARENSSVVAWGNSSVEAWGNSIVRIFWDTAKVILHGFSVAFLPISIKVDIKKESKYAIIQTTQDLGWFERNCIEQTKKVILYKKVSKDFKTREKTANETHWKIGKTLTHKNWSPDREECGEGKFHACSRPYFCDEFRNNIGDRYIAIEIALEDLHEWKNSPSYPYKIAFRKGKVLFECDKFGKEIKKK